MLCSRENDSYVMRSLDKFGGGDVLRIEGRNFVTGVLGKCLDDLLIKRPLRKCLLIGTSSLGKKLPNGTYTESLGLLQSRQAHLYLRGSPDFLHEEWLAKSVPIAVEETAIIHPIHNQRSTYIFNLLQNFNVGFTLVATFVVSLLGILAISFLLNELTRRVRWGETAIRARASKWRPTFCQRTALAVNSFRMKRGLSAVATFVLFAQIFIWFTQLFLTNNIKTNKVVVDTSLLIKDSADIFRSSSVACLVENKHMVDIMISSSTKSIFSRIVNEKTRLRPEMLKERDILKNDRCLLNRDPRVIELLDSDVFLFTDKSIVNLLMAIPAFAESVPKHLWLNTRASEHTSNLVAYYLREKPRIGWEILLHVENGLIKRMYDYIEIISQANSHALNVTIFETLDAFIEEFVGFSDLEFSNFHFIFLYYGLICSLVFVAFCLHHLANFTRKRAILIRSWFEICKNRLRQIRFW